MNYPDKIIELVENNFSGSSELLEKLLTIFLDDISLLKNDELLLSLKNELYNFTAIQNFLNKIILIEENSRFDFINNYLSNFNNEIERIYKNFIIEITPSSLLTISNSYTIQKVIEKLFENNPKLEVTVCESRPILEGRILTEKLSCAGIKTRLITEAQIPSSIFNCDCAIVGADKILNNGNVVNKVGSNLIAICSAYYNRPFYVVSTKNKLTDENKFIEDEKPIEEIYQTGNKLIQITNNYFEEIDSSLITKIITD